MIDVFAKFRVCTDAQFLDMNSSRQLELAVSTFCRSDLQCSPRVGVGATTRPMDLPRHCNCLHGHFHYDHATERLPVVHPKESLSPGVPSKICLPTVRRKPSAGALGQNFAADGSSGIRPRHQSPRGLAPAFRHVASRGRVAYHGHCSGHDAPGHSS